MSGVTSREINGSSSMFIGEGFDLSDTPNSIPGFRQTTNFKPKYASVEAEAKKPKRTIAKFFSNLSRLGMDYDDQVLKNMRAVPADKSLLPKEQRLQNNDLFTQMINGWKKKENKDQSFFEKDFDMKREILRKLAVQPELEDILDTMTNECIVYDTNNVYFAEPFIDERDIRVFDSGIADKIKKSMSGRFAELYKMLNWRTKAWDDFKRFLIEGILSWEIVYDSLEKPTKIIGLVPIDPATITRVLDNNKWYWIQYKGIQGKERKLLDAQVVYIQYQDTEALTRLSYLERLIRPFNIYRIIEQAQIIWTVTNASMKMKFTIPVKGMNRAAGSQTLMSAMNRYKEDIKFISDSGELTINGQVNMPFNKEYWMPESEAGTPEIEMLGGDAPELNDNDQLKYFKNQLYKISKIPLNRFDAESGETWFGADPTSVARTEIDFSRFVTRLRNLFSQIMLKPLTIWMSLDVPELQQERAFLEAVSLHFKSYNPFEEMVEIELMQKRVEFIQNMKDSMVDMDLEGNEIKFFSSKFLVQKYLKLSESDLKLNDELKKEEIKELALAGDPDRMDAIASDDGGGGF